MSKEQLEELASESEEVREERQMLQEETKILAEGLRKCEQNKLRQITGNDFDDVQKMLQTLIH